MSVIGRIHMANIPILPRELTILSKIPSMFFKEIENSSEIHMEPQKTPNCQSNLGQKQQRRSVIFLDFKCMTKLQ